MRLRGKNIVVTGAARGAGAAMVRVLSREGAAVVAVDVLETELAATVAAEVSRGHRVQGLCTDIATEEGNNRAVDLAVEKFGGLDTFIANAAIQRFAMLEETTERIWDEVHAVNLKGAYLGARAAIPKLKQRRGGSIIFTASVLGIVGDPVLAAYGAAKGGLRALTRSIAVAYGPDAIRCNTICPGDIKTRLFDDYIEQAADASAELRKILAEYPLGRIASPDDVANVALFLASDESACITGTDIIVDAGLLAKCY
jgi:NAD(P)-dependent dehydrogenase (short-subunit alcohol dehydrogenase family)